VISVKVASISSSGARSAAMRLKQRTANLFLFLFLLFFHVSPRVQPNGTLLPAPIIEYSSARKCAGESKFVRFGQCAIAFASAFADIDAKRTSIFVYVIKYQFSIDFKPPRGHRVTIYLVENEPPLELYEF
jgi:hypothetical protein